MRRSRERGGSQKESRSDRKHELQVLAGVCVVLAVFSGVLQKSCWHLVERSGLGGELGSAALHGGVMRVGALPWGRAHGWRGEGGPRREPPPWR